MISMVSTSLAYDCLLALSEAALQTHTNNYFPVDARNQGFLKKTFVMYRYCDMCEISCEACYSKYAEAVVNCLRLCSH